MTTLFSFLSPIATVILVWLSFIFLLFLPPLWILWPVLIGVLVVINYRGIRHALGHAGKGKPWHGWFNMCECIAAVWILSWLWP